MIKEDYVSFEQAKILKEKGFPVVKHSPYCCYTEEGKLLYYCPVTKIDFMSLNLATGEQQVLHRTEYFYAPTLSIVQKWLRETHDIFISIIFDFCEIYWHIRKKGNPGEVYSNSTFDKYEDALSDAINKALELI